MAVSNLSARLASHYTNATSIFRLSANAQLLTHQLLTSPGKVKPQLPRDHTYKDSEVAQPCLEVVKSVIMKIAKQRSLQSEPSSSEIP